MVDLGLGKLQRISQSQGPLKIEFKNSKDDFDSFINIDGEYFMLRNPKRVVIESALDIFEGGVVNILERVKSK